MKNLFSKPLSSKKWTIICTSFIVFVTTLGILYFKSSEKSVALTFNGHKKVVTTRADTVKDLFDEMHVPIHSQDYLFPKKNTQLKEHLNIIWKQAKQVQIVNGNEKKTVWTTANTVGELMKEQNLVLNEHDQISPGPEEKIMNGMKVGIYGAFRLTLVDGGKQKLVWSTSTTVADFLTQQGIKLQALDRVEPSLSDTISENDKVNVIRVEKVTDVVEEPIQFAVVTKKDSNLAIGSQKVVTEGQQGLVSNQYEVILENGKEVSRKLISQNKVRNKMDKIVAVGTKNFTLQGSRGEGSIGKEFYVSTTAYTADCNGCSGHTSTGIDLHSNPNVKVIAVDPRIIPLGTKVYVEGYGYAIAADTGSSIKGYKIDVFFSSKSDAYRWGSRKIKIKVLQ
ncbi:MAG: ubiquitin-like domain-containing protein [Bacillota bacterium]|nr:ubiquitin-like domain-containing protein [Bacillota bacterium]